MAIKISWQEPEDTNITQVKILKSTTKHGTYSEVDTIDATSDGNTKSSSNTWVTHYIDSGGTTTYWYKIQFYDGTNLLWSEYSDPITGKQEIKLCSVDDVKQIMNTTGRWTDTEIFDAILAVEKMIYLEMGTPIKAIWSPIERDDSNNYYTTYYVGEENIHKVDRVFYGTTTKTEVFLDDGYKTNVQYGMIRILPVASGGPTMDSDCDVEIRFVPGLYNRLATFRTAKFLLDRLDYISDGKANPEVELIDRELEKVENIHMRRIGVVLSSHFKNYDDKYSVNRQYLRQDHDRNKYIGNYGWD